MTLTNQKQSTQLLGLDLDHGQLNAVVLRKSGDTAEVRESGTGPLAMDPLKNEPELVGREMRKTLDAAGIKERRCVVHLPVAWVLTMHIRIPEIDEGDIPEFLALEAERGFARDSHELVTAISMQNVGKGARFATQIGVPRDYVAKLEACLEAAGLKPFGFLPSILALPGAVPSDGSGRITVLMHETRADLLVAAGGGVVALRTLDGLVDEEGGERRLQADLFARELRITIRQLPEELREKLRSIHISGKVQWARQLADELRPRVESMGLQVRWEEGGGEVAHGFKIANGMVVTPELGIAALYLSGTPHLEFLPPRASLFQRFSERYSGKKLAWAGAVAGVVLAAGAAGFLVQHLRLQALRTEWNGMKSRVEATENLQGEIRKFRPWFGQRDTSLEVMRRLAESFPEEGSVSAKSVEIQNANRVTVAGTAKDHASLLRTIEKLRAVREVATVQVGAIGGKSPMQFTFTFQWGEGITP